MSKARDRVLIANSINIVVTFIYAIILFTELIPGNYKVYRETGNTESLIAVILILLTFAVCLAGQVINWIGYSGLGGLNSPQWGAWFLVIGILTLVVNPISAVFYLLAYRYAHQDMEEAAAPEGLAELPVIGDRTLQANLSDLLAWGILSDVEAAHAQKELQI